MILLSGLSPQVLNNRCLASQLVVLSQFPVTDKYSVSLVVDIVQLTSQQQVASRVKCKSPPIATSYLAKFPPTSPYQSIFYTNCRIIAYPAKLLTVQLVSDLCACPLPSHLSSLIFKYVASYIATDLSCWMTRVQLSGQPTVASLIQLPWLIPLGMNKYNTQHNIHTD